MRGEKGGSISLSAGKAGFQCIFCVATNVGEIDGTKPVPPGIQKSEAVSLPRVSVSVGFRYILLYESGLSGLLWRAASCCGASLSLFVFLVKKSRRKKMKLFLFVSKDSRNGFVVAAVNAEAAQNLLDDFVDEHYSEASQEYQLQSVGPRCILPVSGTETVRVGRINIV